MSTVTNTQWLTNLGNDIAAMIAGTLDPTAFVTAMQTPTDGWIGIAVGDPVLATKVSETVTNFIARDNNFDVWINGTPTGGAANSSGTGTGGPYYPLRNLAGGITWWPSPAGMVSSTQKGDPGGIPFLFLTATTDADPGSGKFKFDNATFASITKIFIDNNEAGGTSVAAWLDSFDDSTTTSSKGIITFLEVSTSKFATFRVTGSIVDGTGYRKISVTPLAGNAPFSNNSRVVAIFSPTGDQGDKGWSPTTAVINDGDRRVRKLVDWIGGQGTKPATTSGGLDLYEGASGFTTTISDATDVRGPVGPPLYQVVKTSQSALYDDLAHGADAFGLVYNDPVSSDNNGTYVKARATGTGSWVKAATASGITFQPLPIESGFVGAYVDSLGRMSWGIKPDGTFKPFRFEAPTGSITLDALATAVLSRLTSGPVGAMLQSLLSESGPAFAVTDTSGAVGLSLEQDATLFPRKLRVGPLAYSDDKPTLSLASRLLASANGAFFQAAGSETGKTFVVTDQAGVIAATFEPDATFYPRRLRIPAAAFVDDNPSLSLVSRLLTAAVGSMFGTAPQESGRAFSISDSNGRVILSIPYDASQPIQAYVARAKTADNALSSYGPASNASYAAEPYADGGGLRQIRVYRLADGRSFKPTTSGNNVDPVFLTDGRMAFASDSSGSWARYVVAPEGGVISPMVADDTSVATWGDSLSSNTYQTSLASQTGKTVNSYGVPSQVSAEIMARQGGKPALLTVTSNQIPTSGAVSITARSVDFLTSLATPTDTRSMLGTLAGVPGTVTKDSSNNYTFTRTSSGSVVACPAASPFTPSVGESLRAKAAVFWPGTNDVFYGISRATFLANVLAGADYYLPLVKRLIVMGPLNRNNEPSGSANYIACVGMNSDLAAAAPAHGFAYFDVRSYLIQHGLTDAGITPTSQDLIDIGNDIVPTSLRVDSVHLNSTGYTLVATQLKLIINSFDV